MASISITPATIDISLPMAITKSIDYTFKHIDGTPINITTATLLFTVKDVASDQDATDSTALIKKELSITDGANGMANLFLTQDDTFIPVGEYFYDIKLVQTYVSSSTTVDAALIGAFTITDDSTNRVVGIT
jgi:hypothetical protein